MLSNLLVCNIGISLDIFMQAIMDSALPALQAHLPWSPRISGIQHGGAIGSMRANQGLVSEMLLPAGSAMSTKLDTSIIVSNTPLAADHPLALSTVVRQSNKEDVGPYVMCPMPSGPRSITRSLGEAPAYSDGPVVDDDCGGATASSLAGMMEQHAGADVAELNASQNERGHKKRNLNLKVQMHKMCQRMVPESRTQGNCLLAKLPRICMFDFFLTIQKL